MAALGPTAPRRILTSLANRQDPFFSDPARYLQGARQTRTPALGVAKRSPIILLRNIFAFLISIL